MCLNNILPSVANLTRKTNSEKIKVFFSDAMQYVGETVTALNILFWQRLQKKHSHTASSLNEVHSTFTQENILLQGFHRHPR